MNFIAEKFILLNFSINLIWIVLIFFVFALIGLCVYFYLFFSKKRNIKNNINKKNEIKIEQKRELINNFEKEIGKIKIYYTNK